MYRYTYNKQVISKGQFESVVPKDWKDHIDETGCYSFGYYRAIKID
jgi:hypothetical protein